MIHAQDFRIGNWILYDGHEYRVWGIQYVIPDVAYQVIIDAHKGVGGYDFDGIPLSEEWLERFGFTLGAPMQKQDSYFKDGVELANSMFVDRGFRFVGYREGLINVQYVHQLQNLYFALTGQELTAPSFEKKI